MTQTPIGDNERMNPRPEPLGARSADGSSSSDPGEKNADAVVIGSGFGGSVAAARLAQAGLNTVVLERGRRWPSGSFPRNEDDIKDGWLWNSGRGLYDLRWLDRMISVQGAGWGGGSLIYANVFARPPAEVFEHWPAAYTRSSLDHYYDLAAHMLEVTPTTADPVTGRLPLRTLAMRQVVADLGRPTGTVNPQVAVRIQQNPDDLVDNLHGARQRGCAFIGECVLGCNRGAKNSLDYNYLHVAERHGAQARVGCEVTEINPVDGGYRVTYLDHEAGGTEQVIVAPYVFLGAGAVGTTELLMRARDIDGSLAGLSDTLGSGFSGNGDFLAFIKRARTPLNPGHGPTITTTSIVGCEIRGRRIWFQVQDGSYPERLGLLIRGLNPAKGIIHRIKTVFALLATRTGLHFRTSGPRRGENRMTLLLMGRDTSNGRLSLDHNGEARVSWDNAANRDLYRAQGRVSRQIARQLGGRAGYAPSWSLLRQAVTVHNLGGVPMGATAREGVVNDEGQVHGHPGLFVLDGAVIPAATGVNPSATILAVAERIIEGAIRTITGDATWCAPETPQVERRDVPEDHAMHAMAEARAARLGGGVQFSETLAGFVQMPHGRTPITLKLFVSTNGLAALEADPRHELTVAGSVAIGISRPCAIAGTFALFPAAIDAAMQYELKFVDPAGVSWSLQGAKHQKGTILRTWSNLTKITFVLSDHQGTGHPGTARISPNEVARMVASLRGSGYSLTAKMTAVARFICSFARNALLTGKK